MKERELQKYLRKCRLLPVEPGPVVAGFRCAAVIPACDELEEIGNTLASLAPGADDMVLLVVNHPADAPSRVKAASGELLRLLASGAFSCRNLFCSSPAQPWIAVRSADRSLLIALITYWS